jgi:hypothetical protein
MKELSSLKSSKIIKTSQITAFFDPLIYGINKLAVQIIWMLQQHIIIKSQVHTLGNPVYDANEVRIYHFSYMFMIVSYITFSIILIVLGVRLDFILLLLSN